eukprot:352617-Chlamydomonas_euryale.AAC.3
MCEGRCVCVCVRGWHCRGGKGGIVSETANMAFLSCAPKCWKCSHAAPLTEFADCLAPGQPLCQWLLHTAADAIETLSARSNQARCFFRNANRRSDASLMSSSLATGWPCTAVWKCGVLLCLALMACGTHIAKGLTGLHIAFR